MAHHHQGPHHFDPERFLAMEAWRRTILAPEVALSDFLPDSDAILADIGAGAGFFAVPAARALPGGKVYAVDRQEDMLAALSRRAREEGLRNLEAVRAEASSLPLADASVDAVLMANVFHDIEDRAGALREVRRVLREGGAFYLVEWDPKGQEAGPPPEIRIAPGDLTKTLQDAGFTVALGFDGPSPFYRVLARR